MSSKHRVVIAIVLSVLVGVAATLLVSARRSGDTTSSSSGAGAPLDELEALIDKTASSTYHARYALTGPAVTQQGATVNIESWRTGGVLREDRNVTAGTGKEQSRSLQLASGPVVCANSQNTAWACHKGADVAAGGAEESMAALRQQLAGATVTVRDDVVAKVPVRCFTVTFAARAAATTEACLTRAGVPARQVTGADRLELVTLDQVVPADVFQPPAVVTG